MSTEPLDFGRLAARYDELRPADENWWELTDVIVREGDLRGRRVLEIGCGTGRLAAALAEREGCKVWAVDPSPEMLGVARTRVPRSAGVRQGRAEALRFEDGWFERVVMRLVVHLVDRRPALAEARRVLGPGGRLVVATFDPSHFDLYWLNDLFPSLERIDRARFAAPAELADELVLAGFAETRVAFLAQRATLDREGALEKIRGRHISTFDLIGEDEYAEGLERAERELPARVDYALEWAVVVGLVDA